MADADMGWLETSVRKADSSAGGAGGGAGEGLVMLVGVASGGSAGDDCISSILRELVALLVMLLETSFSAAGTPPSTILIGILFRTGAARAGLSDAEGVVGVGILAASGEPFSVFGGAIIVVAATLTGGGTAVTDLVGGGLTVGSESGFHIGPLGGTAYRMHKSQFTFIFTRSHLFLSFNLRDPSHDAVQFLPRERVIWLDLDHFEKVYASARN